MGVDEGVGKNRGERGEWGEKRGYVRRGKERR